MKISIISGSRADWPGLETVADQLKGFDEVIVSKMWDDRAAPQADNRAEKSAETLAAMAFTRSVILAHDPDLLIINGDRTEILAAAMAAYVMQVPLAHLSGGDRTAGSADDAMRDAISMLASIHFPTNQDALYRLINELGIPGSRVHCVGSPAVDRLFMLPKVSREALFPQFKLNPAYPLVMVAVHPDTITGSSADVTETLVALDLYHERLKGKVSIVIVSPNSDLGFRSIVDQVQLFCYMREDTRKFIPNLLPDRYLLLLREAQALVGNSSSGIYEAPYLGTPAINVGSRQKGRIGGDQAWNVPADRMKILDALVVSQSVRGNKAHRPFGEGNSAYQIAKIITSISRPADLLRRSA